MRKLTAVLSTLILAAAPAFAQTAAPATKPATGMPAQTMPAQGTPGKAMTTMAPINVNTATEAQLAALPGVGPKLATAMVKARPFKNSADLIKRVKGIGPKNYVKLGLNKELTF